MTFKRRTKQLGLEVIRFVEGLSKNRTSDTIGRQLLRSATSIGADYRAACRGKSRADLMSKLAIVEEEADETLYWLELLAEVESGPQPKLKQLMSETEQILAMTVASLKTLRSNPKSKI
ncbi:MAG TPA: four helix bundle protein [Thermoanaerobaculia bacterium]|nr:four helix bundle protein [Thermoanaerobaculia bacterium]